MCAGFAYFSYYLHLSPAVGAFLAGSIVASLPNAKGFEHAISPYNIIISSFFFIAIGTLINFASIIENIMIILVFVLVVIITKITAFSGMVYFFANMKGDKMFFSSIAMFSVGEFSLLVAKESLKFNIGVDLISIAAAIIAISAIIMTLTINYSDRIYEPAVERLPWKIRKSMDKFAQYIRTVTEEMDIDSRYNRILKKYIGKTIISTLAILLVIFGYRKIILLTEFSSKSKILIYLIMLILSAAILFHLIVSLKKVISTIAEIFDNATNTRSIYQSKKIVKRAFIGSITLGIALIWPFIMFLLNTSPYLLILSYLLTAFSVWEFHKISQSMNENLEYTRDKYTMLVNYNNYNYKNSLKDFNKGWKF
ncbi:MAG: hypothetical protein KatS3mg002_1603 [Candidatus Woesearchaeota archaeon]|nr:MAG: hypothetical protein KatS3mg002_1603 [Candidatus Woesearchaeota archaeon]